MNYHLSSVTGNTQISRLRLLKRLSSLMAILVVLIGMFGWLFNTSKAATQAAAEAVPASKVRQTLTHFQNASTATCNVPSGSYTTIQSAVNDAGCETINLVGAIYTETVVITDRIVSIAGQSAASTTINGGANGSVFAISANAIVTLTNMTIKNGLAQEGGGIHNAGTVHVFDSTITENTAGVGGGVYNIGHLIAMRVTWQGNTTIGTSYNYGGGIHNVSGDVTVTDSLFDGNETAPGSGSDGGGISTLGGKVEVNSSTFTNNASEWGAGGIFNKAGVLIVSNSNFVGNTALNEDQGQGGGIRLYDGTAVITNSTFIYNLAGSRGGGVVNYRGTVQISGSTFYNNTAIFHQGGGIYNLRGSTTLRNSTMSSNQAPVGGGIYSYDGSMMIINTTIVSNTADTGGGIYKDPYGSLSLSNSIVASSLSGSDCSGTAYITSLGYNLDSDDTCHLQSFGDIPGVVPQLAPLQDNGGPTWTHALLTGSPAIDAGDCYEGTITEDQRGVSRPQEAACDIGAFELEQMPNCALDLTLDYANDDLTLSFEMGTMQPARWQVFQVRQTVKTIYDTSLQIIDPPITVSLTIPGVPHVGTIGILTTLSTAQDGILCSDFETVDTGPGTSDFLLHRLHPELPAQLESLSTDSN